MKWRGRGWSTVLQDDDELQTFAVWWKSKDEDDVVEVQYPHHRHGLAGKPSNYAKQDVLSQFLEFVDANSLSQTVDRQAATVLNSSFFPSLLAWMHLGKERRTMMQVIHSVRVQQGAERGRQTNL